MASEVTALSADTELRAVIAQAIVEDTHESYNIEEAGTFARIAVEKLLAGEYLVTQGKIHRVLEISCNGDDDGYTGWDMTTEER